MNELEINGIKYIPREESSYKGSKKLFTLMAMASMFSGMSGFGLGGGRNGKPDREVDIIKEFELIQQKKSQLTRSERNWVENQFYQNFKQA